MKIARSEWEKLISFCAVPSEDGFRFSSSLYQNIATEVLTQMIKYLNLKHQKAKQTSRNLTKEEKEILPYVSGYVALALHRKYCRILKTGKNNIIATAALQVLDTFKVSGGDSSSSENFKKYGNSWLDVVNRGRLLKISQGFFNLICCVETPVQRYLNIDFLKQYKDEDFRETIKIEILNDDFTDICWENLTSNFVNKS